MIMEKAVRQQICSMILVLALLSFFFFFPISESSPFLLTIPIALLSTIILVTLTKKKGSVEENLVHEKLQKEELEYFTAEVESESENLDLNLRVDDDKDEQHCNSQSDSSSSSLVSDSESSSTSSMMGKGCEIDDNYKDQNAGMCYSLVSENDDEEDEDEDEDSLIEIDLLSSSFSGFGEEQKHKMQTKVPHDFLPESIFKHKDLMGLLAETIEMNEDDNLIEIDISMDSTIKCQDLRLKQELALLGEQ